MECTVVGALYMFMLSMFYILPNQMRLYCHNCVLEQDTESCFTATTS